MSERKKVFICSPFRGDMEGNARKAAGYCRTAWKKGVLPVAPHLLFPQFLNEGIEVRFMEPEELEGGGAYGDGAGADASDGE